MRKQDKELLLQDLCAKLPYRVKCAIKGNSEKTFVIEGIDIKYHNTSNIQEVLVNITCESDQLGYIVKSSNIIPYLFPLSSIAEGQKKELHEYIEYLPYVESGWICVEQNNEIFIPAEFINFCHKHHFDCRGLIEKGLAIDCTNMKIY